MDTLYSSHDAETVIMDVPALSLLVTTFSLNVIYGLPNRLKTLETKIIFGNPRARTSSFIIIVIHGRVN